MPWPGILFARRRGGSSGSVCGTPFFPRVLVGLVGLQHLVIQRHPVAVPEGGVLEPVPQCEQLRAVAFELPRQLRGGHSLGDPSHDQGQFAGPSPGAVEGRVGEGVEHPAAVAAAVVQHRGAAAAMDAEMVRGVAARASEPVRVQPADETVIAGLLIHQIGDREVHGGLAHSTTVRTPLNLPSATLL